MERKGILRKESTYFGHLAAAASNWGVMDGEYCYWFLNAEIEIKCGEDGIEFTVTGEQHCDCTDYIIPEQPSDPQGDPPSEYGEADNDAKDMGCTGGTATTPDTRKYKIKRTEFEGDCPKGRRNYHDPDGPLIEPRVKCDGSEDIDITEKLSWEDIKEALEGKYHEEGGSEDLAHHPHNTWATAGNPPKIHRVVSRGMRGMAKKCGAAEGTDSDGSETLDVTSDVAECMAKKALCCEKGNDSDTTEREAVMEQIFRKKIKDTIPKILCIFRSTSLF